MRNLMVQAAGLASEGHRGLECGGGEDFACLPDYATLKFRCPGMARAPGRSVMKGGARHRDLA
ncbi:MAG: hypothetical protein LBT40_17950 [Deltaproteobacteria bacterium]|nr:hypothetical protein [Deltaproteobacteria bacterium]